MNSQTTSVPPNDDSFSSRILHSISLLREVQFNGQLLWIDRSRQQPWSFYFAKGYLCYATGGTHPVRRWFRTIAHCCPSIKINFAELQQDLSKADSIALAFGWEYFLLSFWVKQQKITHQQAAQIIQLVLSDVLLQLSETQDLSYKVKQLSALPKPLLYLDEKQVVLNVEQFRQKLRNYSISVSFLNQCPVIKHPEHLQARVSANAYQALLQLVSEEKTLLDLAVQSKVNLIRMASTLLPYLQAKLVELVDVPDLPQPVHSNGAKKGAVPAHARPLIACIDDSTIVCWTMENLLTAAGYQFIGITDGFRAITTLLQHKPDLIFLDVFMPGANGYEICKNLRKAPSFRHTPIIFLTGLDGIVDQVRAKLSGASDFLSKPIDSEKVLSVISLHLSQEKVTSEPG